MEEEILLNPEVIKLIVSLAKDGYKIFKNIYFLLKSQNQIKKHRYDDYLLYWFIGLKENEIDLINKLKKEKTIEYSISEFPISIQGNGLKDGVSPTFYHWFENKMITFDNTPEREENNFLLFKPKQKFILNAYPEYKKIKIKYLNNK